MPTPLQINLDKQNTLVTNMRNDFKSAKESGQNLTAEFKSKMNTYKNELNTLKDEAKKLEEEDIGSYISEQETSITNYNTRLSDPSPVNKGNTDAIIKPYTWKNKLGRERTLRPNNINDSTNYINMFDNYLRGSNNTRGFTNALRTDDELSGGYFVAPTKFLAGILREVEDATYISSLARTYFVEDAQSLSMRKRTAKVNAFDWGSEIHNITANEDSSLAFGVRSITPHYITGMIKLSRDLVRMASIDMEDLIREEFGYDLAPTLENSFLTGTGVNQPLGVLVPSTFGIPTSRDVAAIDADVASGEDSTTHFGFNTLLRAIYSLKQQHRSKARWMLHRDTVFRTATIRDTTGQYIWQPSKVAGEPATICGYPFDESEHMPNTFTAGQYFGLFCNWNYYYIAIGMRLEMQRLNELSARTNQYEYHMRMKIDAQPMLEEAFARLKLAAS